MPRISVVMPVYNGESYLEETLDSLLAQSFQDYEVVCVNDSSTDRSLQILERYAQLDLRIKVYTKPNQGLASFSVAYGLERATGQYYMYSSQDDLYDVDLLKKGIELADEMKADVVIPNLVCYSGNKDDISIRTFWRETVPDFEHVTPHDAFVLSLDWRIHGFGLYRTEIVKRVGIETFNYNSDEYTTRKLLLNCSKIVFSDAIFYYRINNPNAITKKMSFKLFDVFYTNQKLEELALEQKVPMEAIIKLRELALNDVAIRQKLLFIYGDSLSGYERREAALKVKNAYRNIRDKKELYKNDKFRRLLFTHGFKLLKFSMRVRAFISK
ncbi:MAG: glycosyltransferase family 2 protein [Odoribacter splanchnicus]|nr:glycosyltransferase family 2 protein [Odoribacter splanchnicus]